jgi:hypothetical protein
MREERNWGGGGGIQTKDGREERGKGTDEGWKRGGR